MAKASLGTPVPVGVIDPSAGNVDPPGGSIDPVERDIDPPERSVPANAPFPPDSAAIREGSDGNAEPSSLTKLWVESMMAPFAFWTSTLALILQGFDRVLPVDDAERRTVR